MVLQKAILSISGSWKIQGVGRMELVLKSLSEAQSQLHADLNDGEFVLKRRIPYRRICSNTLSTRAFRTPRTCPAIRSQPARRTCHGDRSAGLLGHPAHIADLVRFNGLIRHALISRPHIFNFDYIVTKDIFISTLNTFLQKRYETQLKKNMDQPHFLHERP